MRQINKNDVHNKIFVITGQTATGKTSSALKFAHQNKGELISCDSRQIYKYLDIITGKDVKGKFNLEITRDNFDIGYFKVGFRLSEVKLWLCDVVKPDQYFSSFDFKSCALFLINKLLTEGKTPVIVGGTYLYLKHLLYGLDTENIPPDWKIRKVYKNKTVAELQTVFKNLDLQSFNRLNNSEKNNPQRLLRKIEILIFTRKLKNSISPKLKNGREDNALFNLKNNQLNFIGLKFKNKEKLRKAIEKRVEARLKQGAIDEVKKLLKMGYLESDPGLRTIGYQQLILYLKGKTDLDTAIRQWINKEIQYAKRQLTFMKKDVNISWREI